MKRLPLSESYRVRRWASLSVVALAMVVLLCLSSVPEESSKGSSIAGVGPKFVYGVVYDFLGNPVAGSSVNVTVKSGSTIRKTLFDTTNSTGGYDVTFANSDWDVGNTIEVNATIDSLSAINSTGISGEGPQRVDVRFAVPIPEFGSSLIVVAMIVVLFSLFRVRLRR